ncbi:hypothetical protein Vretimale_9714 [Volvox reticuliferus]|uniref:Uncharacterized protein n=1 Tax=Volvox reticuliferus TaxID=1737510 RepID=A0A8J4CKE3_9CHLO|nr:hypothetical protein Vretifemale_13419 [Volvox reticuliferus]GIM05263.1 hypothetical protein Vretimale_9714 [Volvox reticuliferus]
MADHATGVSSTTGRWGSAATSTSSPAAHSGVFVDAITGRHASTSAAELLAMRRLTWDKHYGWTYDAWVHDPARFALAGANGRFSLPALARGFSATLTQAAGSAAVAVQQLVSRAAQQQLLLQQQQEEKPE